MRHDFDKVDSSYYKTDKGCTDRPILCSYNFSVRACVHAHARAFACMHACVCVCERDRENSGKYGLGIKSDKFHYFFIKSYVADTSQVTLNEKHNI